MKVSSLTKLSVVLGSVLKPDWKYDIWLLDSKNQVSFFQVFYIDNLLKLKVYNYSVPQDLYPVWELELFLHMSNLLEIYRFTKCDEIYSIGF